MTVSLKKNEAVSLAKQASAGLNHIMLGVGWDAASTPKTGGFLKSIFGGSASSGSADIDLDASCIAFDASGDVVDMISFMQLISCDGSIRHSGDNLTGDGEGDDETIAVDLKRLPVRIETLVLTINSFRGQPFSDVANAYGRVINTETNQELARFEISDSGSHTGLILAKLKRNGGNWDFQALGERTSGRTVSDLAGIAARLI